MLGIYNPELMNIATNSLNIFRQQVKAQQNINPPKQDVPAPQTVNSNMDEAKIQGIINNYSKDAPIGAKDYIKASQETGVPIDALLTQGAIESNFGTKGAAVSTKNIGNVGNTDSGALEYQKSFYDGILRQANLLKNEYNYEGGFTADKFIENNFTRPRGGRYATDPNYGKNYSSVLKSIRNKLK